MKQNIFIIAFIAILCMVPLFFWVFQGGAYEIVTFLDINSGDLRLKTYIFKIPIKEEIDESLLSKEVRRLGITIPQGRLWKPMLTKFPIGGSQIHGRYMYMFGEIKNLMHELDLYNVSDKERYDILKKVMIFLQNDSKGIGQDIQDMTDALISERNTGD